MVLLKPGRDEKFQNPLQQPFAGEEMYPVYKKLQRRKKRLAPLEHHKPSTDLFQIIELQTFDVDESILKSTGKETKEISTSLRGDGSLPDIIQEQKENKDVVRKPLNDLAMKLQTYNFKVENIRSQDIYYNLFLAKCSRNV